MSRVWFITKNYLKLIFRKPGLLAVMVLGALLVVATLSSAFRTLLDSSEEAGKFKIGYVMNDESKYAMLEKAVISGFEEQGILSVRYDNANPNEIISSGEADVFVEFLEDGYHIYAGEKKEIQARTVSYVLYRADAEMNAAMSGNIEKVQVKTDSLPYIKTSEAENYYGIIEIVYFMACSSVMLCFIFWTERKFKIGIRYSVGGANAAERYFGKLFACVISAFLCMGVLETILVCALYDVTIGKPLLSMAVIFATTVSFSAFGMIFFLLFDNMAPAIGFMFVVTWFMGLFGGSFETYMYSSISEKIKLLSPLYYVNRSLVELSVNGESDFIVPCFLVLAGVTLVSVMLGIFITSKKKEV